MRKKRFLNFREEGLTMSFYLRLRSSSSITSFSPDLMVTGSFAPALEWNTFRKLFANNIYYSYYKDIMLLCNNIIRTRRVDAARGLSCVL